MQAHPTCAGALGLARPLPAGPALFDLLGGQAGPSKTQQGFLPRESPPFRLVSG